MTSELKPLHRHPNVVLNEQKPPRSPGLAQLKKLVHMSKIIFGTWNTETLTYKSTEVAGVGIRRRINILCL